MPQFNKIQNSSNYDRLIVDIVFLFAPFIKNINLTILLTTMCAMVNVLGLYICISNWIPPMSLGVQICRAILISYGVVLIYGLLRKWRSIIGYIFITIIIVALLINSLIDTIVYLKYHIFFPYDFVIAIRDTNLEEAGAYIDSVIGVDFFLLAVAEVIVYLGVFYLTTILYKNFAPRLIRFRTPYLTGCLCVLLLSVAGTAYGSKLMGGNSDIIGKVILFRKHTPVQEITAKVPELCFMPVDSVDSPDEIIIIVGESLSKDHCQLYGYDKPTQPRLTQLAKDSAIQVFQNARTSASYTILAFRNLIGVWSENLPQDSVWYRCPTFLQIEKAAGYHTSWISCQAEHGIGDSGVSVMSNLADTTFWVPSWLRDRNYYDEELLPLIESRNKINRLKKLTLIHLNGSHMYYQDRYLESRSKFRASDYKSNPESQRCNLAEYDNSVLYNDSVIAEIFKLYEDRDALVMYFSDHGEDLYQSDKGFYGHGQPKGSESWEITTNIPFIVYMSPGMKIRHPKLVERINFSVNKEINTTNLTYTLMDITGVYIKGHNEDNKNSFFY